MKQVFTTLIFSLFTSICYGQITAYELVQSWNVSEIQNLYSENAIPDYAGDINFEVKGYKVFYLTPNEKDSLVEATAAVFLPENNGFTSPILSWQHGTAVSNMGVPSAQIDNQNSLGIIAASHGYITLMSDYLGLGEGEGDHNYCHSETEASAIIDLILVSKDFAESQDVGVGEQVFLMGYSQGGHATMAAVKEIEQNYSNEITLTASCPMAGPYSMSIAQTTMLDVAYPNPGYFPYIIFSYQRVYGNLYNTPEDLFMPGFESLLELYDGNYSMEQINDSIWSIGESIYEINPSNFRPLDMIRTEYYNAYLNNPTHPFHLALTDNDLIDFTPQAPMQILHCNADDNVPYENATIAYAAFIESGANAEEVTLIDGGNFDHNDCATFSVISAKLWFDTMLSGFESIGLNETITAQEKNLYYVMNLLGEIVNPKTISGNAILLYVYDDGSVEKKINTTTNHY
ncbi:MAG: lipase family protein [Flavobacteriales bacterium]|nr:lipase family protein [Flavobacteriales bacterium]